MRLLQLATYLALTALVATSTARPVVAQSAQQPTTSTEVDGRLVLVLDASGSMRERAPGGTTKIAAAKAALTDVVERLPDGAQVGVRVFGATVENRGDKGACSDTQNVVPVGTLDRAGLVAAVDDYQPFGETPIGNALKGAAQDLGPTGKRTIVLLSDGEPTCDPDPCKVARDLRADGVDLTVNVVGLNVSGAARTALECIADAGGGTYYGVDEPDELASSLVSVSARAFREFRVTGTPVVGGVSTADPTDVEPGRYTDTTQGRDTDRYFRVEKPKGSDVVLSAATRPAYDRRSTNRLEVELLTAAGDKCASDSAFRANVLQDASILSAGAPFSPLLGRAPDSCVDATALLARVSVDAPAGTPFEMLISTRPAIENLQALPAATTTGETEAAAAQPFPEPATASEPVAGGAAFTDAPTLEAGTYTDSLRPGEQLIYAIPVSWGQRARVRATVDTDEQGAKELSLPGIVTEITMIAPDLHSLGRTGDNGGGFWTGDRPVALTGEIGEVRARNIESTDDRITSLSTAGDQYMVLSMGGVIGNDGLNFAAPVTITIAMEGPGSGRPEYADGAGTEPSPAPAPGPDTEAAPRADAGEGPPWTVLGISVLAALAITAAFVLSRRRRTGE